MASKKLTIKFKDPEHAAQFNAALSKTSFPESLSWDDMAAVSGSLEDTPEKVFPENADADEEMHEVAPDVVPAAVGETTQDQVDEPPEVVHLAPEDLAEGELPDPPAARPRLRRPATAFNQSITTSSMPATKRRRQRGRRWKERAILIALLVETCVITYQFYFPSYGVSRWERLKGRNSADQVIVSLTNTASVPVFVRVGNQVIALDKGQSLRKAFPKASHNISWWCDAKGEKSMESLAGENISDDANWDFELVYRDGSPVLLRTTPDKRPQ